MKLGNEDEERLSEEKKQYSQVKYKQQYYIFRKL